MNKEEITRIEERLRGKINSVSLERSAMPAGRVKFSGDGVVKIDGLRNAKYGELLDIGGVTDAIVLGLYENEVDAIVLGEEDKASAGMIVKATGRIVEVPVGKKLLGRVINPLGVPIDGLGVIKGASRRPIEAPAPEISERGRVDTPLQTGILAIDSMVPIGRGQRELIIGDRQTGKTSIAVDTVINQKGKDVVCVYVAIGQKASNVAAILHTLNEHDAMSYTVIVCSTAKDSAPLQYIAPFSGCAIAEEFMHKGKDVLIIYDDLSKHAVAYRAMSLLLKRPPGREAYPGDIFYLHSRLLERAAKLSDENGGGSITALPIVETMAGDISAYVPTNIISITDGQIYLESELFNSGIRPAVNVGLSVSRVGSAAQLAGMKKVSGKLRLDLSQYRELAVFAQFGSELDPLTAAKLEQGKRITETLKQEERATLDVEHEIVLLYLAVKELLKKVPVKDIADFNKEFLKYLDAHYPDVVQSVKASGDLNMEAGITIEDAVNEFGAVYFKE